MGKTMWTDEQLKAIETRNCNLLIAAAAGSGKTAVLVERIIRIITDTKNPVDIDKLLVVTFTSAAAAEMRERIAAAITKALEKNPNSKNLQKQLTLLSRANITTMHSFCLDVIKNNFNVIDLDPAFRILNDTESVLLKDEILEEIFDEKYENENKEFMNLVEAYCSSKNDDKLKNIILDLHRFSMSGPWPEKWLREKSEEFNINTLDELNSSKWVQILKENIKIELEGLISMECKARELCINTAGLEAYVENFDSDIELIKHIYDSACGSIENLDFNVSFTTLKRVKKGEVEDINIQDRVKGIRDDVKKKLKKLNEETFAKSPKDMLSDIQKVYPYMKTLCNVVIEFEERFSASKREKGALDFNDLEHLCLKILTNEDSNVAEEFKQNFYEVLVDEYQDSNSVQEAIIDLVSRKNTNDPNVFMVGDVKQSIYRFRQAKPELFLQKYDTYSKDKGKNIKIQLYKNFRSRKNIIDGVNYIFKELMSSTVGELEYTDEEALNLGASYEDFDNNEGYTAKNIEVNILDKSKEEEQEALDNIKELAEEEDISAINLEARIVCRKIKELMDGKDGKKYKVFDKETGQYRNVQYKDIVILLRATKNWAEIFLEEIGQEGIPIYADTSTGYFESIEIRTMMSMLKVIDNPMQDVALIALLKSPIMNFSVEELSKIRLRNKENYIFTNIKEIAYDENLENNLIRQKCIRFIDKLDKWRMESIYTPIDEFIWKLYSETGYYGYVGGMPNGILRQANLKMLFQRAKQYEETSFKGLFNFINFINKLRKSSGDMGSAKILGENENVVRIMSIHKSKGLEFPVVFLCGTGKQFNLLDLNNNILYHEDLGLGPDYVDIEKRVSYTTLPKEAIKYKMKIETLSEEMRILYVAFTRAKEKLIITGATNDLEKLINKSVSAAALDESVILSSEVLKGKSYLDWITMALCKHVDGQYLRDIVGISPSDIHIKDDLSTWKIKKWIKSDLLVDNISESVDENEKLKEIQSKNINFVSKEIANRLDYKYDYEESTKMKSNFSVSDLKKKNYEENEIHNEILKDYKIQEAKKDNPVPKFLKKEDGLTSSEKGTAMHFAMQKINLNKVNSIEEIEYQVKELLNNELISVEEYKAINCNKIYKFFESNLGKRMLKSQKVYKEFPFYTEIPLSEVLGKIDEKIANEKVRLQGIIDCFFYENNEIILLDYKTDYVKNGCIDDIVNRYKIQLKYYKEALEKISNVKIKEIYLYLFNIDKEIKVQI